MRKRLFFDMGGRCRHGTVVGVHRPSFSAKDFAALSLDESQNSYDRMTDQVRSYLLKMDIPDHLIRLMFSYSSERMRYLTPQEIEPISGLPPAIDERAIARCGPRRQTDMSWHRCVEAVYEEVSRQGAADFLRRYGN